MSNAVKMLKIFSAGVALGAGKETGKIAVQKIFKTFENWPATNSKESSSNQEAAKYCLLGE